MADGMANHKKITTICMGFLHMKTRSGRTCHGMPALLLAHVLSLCAEKACEVKKDLAAVFVIGYDRSYEKVN